MHDRLQTTWSASHLSQPGFGGYYQVGVFDTATICIDCGSEWIIATKNLPLCQKCLTPMSEVPSNNPETKPALERFKAKQKRDWQRYCDRMERIEAEHGRRQPPRKPPTSFFEALHQAQSESQDSMIRILRGSSRQQVWPYCCTNPACVKCHSLKFLHTPGD